MLATSFCEPRFSLAKTWRPLAVRLRRTCRRSEGRASGDQPLLIEILDDAAEIAGIEPQLDADVLCGQLVAMRQLVEHPRLAERERALAEMLVEHAELAGIEAVESTDGSDLAVGVDERHGNLWQASIFAIVK